MSYGTSSSTPSSTSSGTSGGTSSSTARSTTNAGGAIAPVGYHYMPDGTLMSDFEHAKLYGTGTKKITGFDMDFSNVPAAGQTRKFIISGDKGAVFSLEVRDSTSSSSVLYYNFETGTFSAVTNGLKNISITGGSYSGNVKFPKNTSAKKYDVFLFSETNYNTSHDTFNEVRFADGNIDINSCTGSDGNLVQKVIYQTLEVDLTVSAFSTGSAITSTTVVAQTETSSRGRSIATTPFSITVSVAAGALSIDRQPTEDDLMSFISTTVGAAPVNIPGEDIYPAVSNTDTVDGTGFAAETTNKFVMDTNVADKMAVGDRVTTAVTNDVVDGAINFGTFGGKIVMTNDVAGKMSVGDKVTIATADSLVDSKLIAFFDVNLVTVTALDPDGDNDKEFSIGPAGELQELISYGILQDGVRLQFSSKFNRENIVVAALNPDTDNAKEFSVKDVNGDAVNVGIRDGATLSFSNQRNHRWPVSNLDKMEEGMSVQTGIYFASATTIQEYLTQFTIFEGEPNEYKVDNVRVPALDTLGASPVITIDGTTKVTTTVQSGNIVFSNQALLSFAGTTLKVFSYGVSEIERLTGYNIEISDLKAELNEVTTPITAAVSGSTTIPVTSKVGIVDKTTQTVDGAIADSRYVVLDSVAGLGIGQKLYAVSAGSLTGTPTITSINETTKTITLSIVQTFADGITLTFPNSIISGPGIDNTAVNPYVDTISSLNLTASAAQTLENARTLTFTGAGDVVTITGNIKVNTVGNEDVTLNFDIDKFLTQH